MTSTSCPIIGGPSFAEHISVDTAGQQSATSFVTPASGLRCPSAKQSFVETSNAFCNGARVYFPWPKEGGQKDKLPAMLRLWKDTDQDSLVATRSVSAECSPSPGPLERFLRFVRGDHNKRAVQWARFQFTEEITKEYFSRADCEPIVAAAADAARILESPAAGQFCAELDSLLVAGEMQLLRDHPSCSSNEAFTRTGQYSREAHYVIAYVYSVYARGWTYNWHLDNPAYRYQPLWLRRVLFSGPASNRQDFLAWQFPWGRIIANVVEQAGSAWRDWSRVEAALQNIRRATTEKAAYRQHLLHFLEHPSAEGAAAFVAFVKHTFEQATGITPQSPELAPIFTPPSIVTVLGAARAARDLLEGLEFPIKKVLSRRELFNLLAGGAFGGAVAWQTTLWMASMTQHVENVLSDAYGFRYDDGDFEIPATLAAFAQQCDRHRSELLVALNATAH